MQKAIIGKKVGMTQIFDESGKVIVPPAMMTKKVDRTNVAFLRHSDIRPHRRAAISPNREIETPKTRPEIGMNGQISSSRP